jgi:hypothetical protein
VDPAFGILVFLAIAAIPAGVIWYCIRSMRQSHLENTTRYGCCPECGYDLRASKGRCSECGIPLPGERFSRLLRDWPADAIKLRPPAPEEKPVVVYESQNSMECNLLRQHLQSRGIFCHNREFPLPGLRRSGPESEQVLIVWSADFDRAKGLIAQLLEEIN